MEVSATLLFDHPSASSISSYLALNLEAVGVSLEFDVSPRPPQTTELSVGTKEQENEGPPILMSRETDGVMLLSYNRPQKNNAFDAAVSGALIATLTMITEDRSILAVVITGRGAYFCTAAKFDEMLRPACPLELCASLATGFVALFASFLNLSKPIVAAVNGAAFGGGVTQATLCDSAVSSGHAKYSLPFSRWRVSPEGCSSVHLARVVGQKVALRMLVDGWIPNSREAWMINLASTVIENDSALVNSAKDTALGFHFDGHCRSFSILEC